MAYLEKDIENRRTLFPPIEPYSTGYLRVDETHELFYEESGNKNGKPVIFLHGGPGAGCSPNSRRFFDPEFYRIITLDQRGAGRSRPNGCMKDNTTWHLVADIEKIREHLGIDAWHIVCGGSWGSTLCLSYAETHPERVKSLVLRGIFLFDRDSMNWLFNGPGASEMYPDAWEKYAGFIPACERGNLLNAYNRRVLSDDKSICLPAAQHFVDWEISISKLQWEPELCAKLLENDSFVIPFARAETHYFVHGGFFQGEDEEKEKTSAVQNIGAGAWEGGLPWILRNVHKIAHIPTAIAHGRQDIVCRPRAAYELHKRMPKSSLVYVHDAGHSDSDPGLTSELVRATERMKADAL